MSIFGEVESGKLLATKPALATEHAQRHLETHRSFRTYSDSLKVLVDTTR